MSSGDFVRVTTARGQRTTPIELSGNMRAGHISLPNGYGLESDADGSVSGIAPNELTSVEDRDPFVGTPWHKHVPARVERV